MAWFGQGKDTIEWEEFRDDVLFYKWPAKEIKRGSRLILRPGQKAIFYSDGMVGAVFENPGNFDIYTDIVPFFSTLQGWFSLRGDTGMRAEVYFVNAKELTLPWGTRQRIMIPTPEVPTGIPVGCNGNLIIEFRDYQIFINKVAGVKETYSLEDVADRIMGELNPVVAEAILGGERQMGLNALIGLQQNSRKLGKAIQVELDKELSEFGLGVADVNILAFNYPPEVQKMAEKVAAQSFITDMGKYTAVSMADSMSTPGSAGSAAAAGMGMTMGMQMAGQMMGMMGQQTAPQPQQAACVCAACGYTSPTVVKFCPQCGKPMGQPQAAQPAGDRFCPTCRKMVAGKFCPDCGTQTV